MRWEQKTPTKCTHTYIYKHTSSRHSDIAVHNEIDKTENQKPNRRVAGYNTATVTLCGGSSSSSVDGCDSGRAARGIHLASPHHTLDSRTPTSRHTYASIHMYAWVCVCVYILCKWWWNCSFCCCQNGNEKTHTQAQTHHSSSSSDGHRKQSDKVKKKWMQVARRCQRHLTMAMAETRTNTCIHTYTTPYMYGHHSTRTGLVLSAMVKHMLEFDRQQLQHWMGLLLLVLLPLRRSVNKICILANWCCCCLCWCSALVVVKMETLQLSISFWCAHCIAHRRRRECVWEHTN